jgi:hypothetical protein
VKQRIRSSRGEPEPAPVLHASLSASHLPTILAAGRADAHLPLQYFLFKLALKLPGPNEILIRLRT